MIAEATADAAFVTETTGIYSFNLALFLHQAGRFVPVVNPVQIKNHMVAKLSRNKSDRSDTFSIARFGQEKSALAWKHPARDGGAPQSA